MMDWVSRTPRHGAYVFAVDQDATPKGFDDVLDKSGHQMGRPLLVLQSPRKMPGDAGEFGLWLEV